MSEARNHHFVPRSYLGGFSNGVGRQARVFVVDRVEKRAFATTARNVGSQRDFNRVDIEGVAPNHMEAFYGRIEDAVTLSVQRIEAAGTIENKDDLENVIVLVMILAVRNPRFRKNISAALSGVYKRVMDLSLSSKKRWDTVTRRMEYDGSTIRTDTTYEEMREFVDRGEYDIVTSTTGHAGLEVRSYMKPINVFGNRRWTLFKAAIGAGDFITSDHRVCLFDKKTSQDGR